MKKKIIIIVVICTILLVGGIALALFLNNNQGSKEKPKDNNDMFNDVSSATLKEAYESIFGQTEFFESDTSDSLMITGFYNKDGIEISFSYTEYKNQTVFNEKNFDDYLESLKEKYSKCEVINYMKGINYKLQNYKADNKYNIYLIGVENKLMLFFSNEKGKDKMEQFIASLKL